MSRKRICDIVLECTRMYRKGPVVRGETIGDIRVVHVDAMPPVEDIPEGFYVCDVHFSQIAVDKGRADAHENELRALLREMTWTTPFNDGPSYISVGYDLGDQGIALQLMALGEYLKFWKVVTPETFLFTGQEAERLAGGGMVMVVPSKEQRVGW